MLTPLIKQINSIDAIANNLNTSIDHIKLHGALYNFSAIDLQTASTVVDLIKSDYPDVFLYAPYQSLISELAIENDIKELLIAEKSGMLWYTTENFDGYNCLSITADTSENNAINSSFSSTPSLTNLAVDLK